MMEEKNIPEKPDCDQSVGPLPPMNNADAAMDAESSGEERRDAFYDAGSIITGNGRHTIHCLTIIGQIEGHYLSPSQNKTTKYEHVIPQLVSVEEDPKIDGLLILLNTVGGDIEAGLALAELVAGMRKPTVSLVLGGGHSIGVPLAVAAKRSFIASTASMTIHPVRVNGLILGVPQTIDYFKRMQDRITRFVTENSRISADAFYRLVMNTDELVLDVGTVLEGEEAVEAGLIDDVGTLSDAIRCLYDMIDAYKEKEGQQRGHVRRNSYGNPHSRRRS